MRTVITRRSRVIADTTAYANAKELVDSVKEGATVTHDGDMITLHSVTPQGHELIGEFVVRHAEGRITVRALRDTLATATRAGVTDEMVERAEAQYAHVGDMRAALEAALGLRS